MAEREMVVAEGAWLDKPFRNRKRAKRAGNRNEALKQSIARNVTRVESESDPSRRSKRKQRPKSKGRKVRKSPIERENDRLAAKQQHSFSRSVEPVRSLYSSRSAPKRGD